MTSLELLKALGGFYDPSKDVQTVRFDGQEYLIKQQYNRFQVFHLVKGEELLVGNV